ncbi:MAG TPA: MerR family transcriptional regulator [Streptosporangiaceae bacterium]
MADTAAAPGGPESDGPLLGIGAAAQRLGVSERALRYYQQLGLLVPACTTPGGLRRYSPADLARVERIRELQTLLGLNLDEIAVLLRNEDRIAQIRQTWHDERTSAEERRQLTRECLVLQESLRDTVEAKRAALESFLADLNTRIVKSRGFLAEQLTRGSGSFGVDRAAGVVRGVVAVGGAVAEGEGRGQDAAPGHEGQP